MIRQSRERPSGELELLIRPLKKPSIASDSDDAYDNLHRKKNLLEQSLETLREDLTSGQLIEQYEVCGRISLLEKKSISSFRCFFFQQTLQRKKDGFTFEISTSQNNYYRNRYKDVLPYDQTRVILKASLDSDYINANFINVNFERKIHPFFFVNEFCFFVDLSQMPVTSTDIVNRYIATQGPLPTTCEAFWTMIWEQECTLLIMLTTLYEK